MMFKVADKCKHCYYKWLNESAKDAKGFCYMFSERVLNCQQYESRPTPTRENHPKPIFRAEDEFPALEE